MQNLVLDAEAFRNACEVWKSKNHNPLKQIELFVLEDGGFAVGVLDYVTRKQYFVASERGYKTREQAFAAVGRQLDKLANND